MEVSPLFHVLFQEFGPTAHAIRGILLVDNFSPSKNLDLIYRERINFFIAVPSMVFLMRAELGKNSRDVSCARRVKCGGAPMSQIRFGT